ncbi:MAG: VTT domain-containing protein [Oscillospiraceae bacterium]|jgi:uncharacterized membrane protein YdjX (TVP38/TMEM64 family)|nr:VTT domain-containing protein [Oscillospiraceae bacterium]
MKNTPSMNRARVLLCLRIALIAGILLAIALNFRRLRALDSAAFAALAAGGAGLAAAIVAVLGVYCAKAILFVIPAMLLYVSVGAAFPLPIALAVNAGGVLLELALTYALGRFLGGAQVQNMLGQNKAGQKLLELQNKRGFTMLFATRFVPAFPIDFTGLFFGASRVPFMKYMAASALGLYPRVFLFTVFGEAAKRFFPPKFLAVLAGAGILTGGILLIIKKRRLRKAA